MFRMLVLSMYLSCNTHLWFIPPPELKHPRQLLADTSPSSRRKLSTIRTRTTTTLATTTRRPSISTTRSMTKMWSCTEMLVSINLLQCRALAADFIGLPLRRISTAVQSEQPTVVPAASAPDRYFHLPPDRGHYRSSNFSARATHVRYFSQNYLPATPILSGRLRWCPCVSGMMLRTLWRQKFMQFSDPLYRNETNQWFFTAWRWSL